MRNDASRSTTIAAARPDRIVISPGPGRPEQAGVTMDVIRELGRATPILGVCLGPSGDRRRVRRLGRARRRADARQDVDDRARRPRRVHGHRRAVRRVALSLAGRGGRDAAAGPRSVTRARRRTATIMGLRHRTWPVHGVQFHPESILTGEGPPSPPQLPRRTRTEHVSRR